MNNRFFDTIEAALYSRKCIKHGCNAKIGSKIVKLETSHCFIAQTFIGAICENCYNKEKSHYIDTGLVTIRK
jgi:hypothetical protein